jgi:hypothetical protein
MRPFRSDRNATMTPASPTPASPTLAALFERRQQDYKSLELALEAGDLARAQRALARCRKDNQEIAVAAGISNSSAVGLIGAILLKTDIEVLKNAFQTGELPPELAPSTALQRLHQASANDAAGDEGREATTFLRDLCTALQSEPPKPHSDGQDGSPDGADDADGRSYQFCIKRL